MKQFSYFKNKSFAVLLTMITMLVLMLSLTACGKIDDKLHSEDEVLQYVNDEMPGITSEKYAYVSVEHVTDTLPNVDIYTFRSLERDFTFTVISTLNEQHMDGTVYGYAQGITIKYVQCVQALYRDRISDLFNDVAHDDYYGLYYDSVEELEEIVHLIIEADAIWSEELEYNSEQFLQRNFPQSYALYFGNEEDRVRTYYIRIDGTHDDFNALYEEIVSEHMRITESISDEAEQSTIPETVVSKFQKFDIVRVLC